MTTAPSRYAASDEPNNAPLAVSDRDRSQDAAVLASLTARDADRPILITGGTVLTRDPAIGDFAAGDVLVRGNRIVEVGADLADKVPCAIIVDASDAIVIPGFVDSHVHAWEGQLRSTAPVLDFPGYLGSTAFGYGPRYRPHDNYVGTLATALVALDAGITTFIDNSHNSRTPDHSNAAVEALFDAGIRAVHASGAPVRADAPHWPGDVERLQAEYFTSDDQLVTLRLFDLYPSAELWEFAKQHDLWVSHDMGAHIENVADVLADLAAKGLLTDKHTFNHCFDLPDKAWELIADSGAAVNVCPRSDAAFGLGSGFPPIDKIRELGLRPGISGDNEISYALSAFSEMQTLLNGQRGRMFQRIVAGDESVPEPLSPADVFEFATLGGAANAGLVDKTGSLTPGKQADVVLVRTTDVNTAPLSNALATLTAFAHPGNVDTVFVDGQVRKFRGVLVGHDLGRIRGLIEASRDYLFAACGQRLDVLAPQGRTSA
ncbi:amidohydrolase family protein [Nocardia sp. NPDC004123]